MSILLKEAAKFYKGEQHQIDAWDWLQAQLSADALELFADKYRNKPKPAPNVDNTWDGVLAAAKTAGAKWPECVAAQWALESGWGKHTSGKNNYFGLKGSGSTVSTQEFINGQWVTIKAGFLDFPDLQTCVCYLVDRWYKDFGRFKGVNRATTRNECCELLVKEGYATDPDYSTKLIQILDNKLGTPGVTDGVISEKILPVPYEYQLDNQSGTGYRECFSSTCAMIARYYDKVKNDDEYNKIRTKYGDTTSAMAQVQACKQYGVAAVFRQTGRKEDLIAEIDKGFPVATGFLHKGRYDRPYGGGHWALLIGYLETSGVFHDPYGELDNINGNYRRIGTGGKEAAYSWQRWLPRWAVKGPGDGWYMTFRPIES